MNKKPIITFLTDFGTGDGYTGAVKGVIKSIDRNIEIIDISHDIKPFNIKMAAFTLLHYYQEYPRNTVHLAVIDPGVGSERDVIIVQTDEHLFVGPDNGLFKYITDKENYKTYAVKPENIYDNTKGSTFHARDIFAPVAARLALGEKPENIGYPVDILYENIDEKNGKPESVKKMAIDCVGSDHFGNIVFDYTKDRHIKSSKNRLQNLQFKNFESNQIYDYYSQVTKGSPLFLWNSLGFLELAICEGSAKDLFQCRNTDKVTITFK
ncbi:MAG: SAM-dependent chlorinase/fluorinase [Calditrichaceae bacterium]